MNNGIFNSWGGEKEGKVSSDPAGVRSFTFPVKKSSCMFHPFGFRCLWMSACNWNDVSYTNACKTIHSGRHSRLVKNQSYQNTKHTIWNTMKRWLCTNFFYYYCIISMEYPYYETWPNKFVFFQFVQWHPSSG